jgi:hypothetical protein
MPKGPLEPRSPEGIMRRVTEIVWDYTFMHYFVDEGRSPKQGHWGRPAIAIAWPCTTSMSLKLPWNLIVVLQAVN